MENSGAEQLTDMERASTPSKSPPKMIGAPGLAHWLMISPIRASASAITSAPAMVAGAVPPGMGPPEQVMGMLFLALNKISSTVSSGYVRGSMQATRHIIFGFAASFSFPPATVSNISRMSFQFSMLLAHARMGFVVLCKSSFISTTSARLWSISDTSPQPVAHEM